MSKSSASSPKLDKARDFFQNFAVALKNISLYRHQTDGFLRFLAPAYQSLVLYHESFGSLNVKVRPFEFHIGHEPVFTDDSQESNLPYKFYREGFRSLSFEVGITDRALLALLDVILRVPRDVSGGVNMNSLLWESDIEGFSYLIVEGFEEDEDDEEEHEDLEKIIDYLRSQLHSESPHAVNFRGLSGEDLSLQENLASAQAQRGLRVNVQPLADEEVQAIHDLLAEEEDVLPLKSSELVLMLLTQFDHPNDIEQLKDIILPIAENLLLIHDFGAMCFLVEDLLAIGEELQDSTRQAFLHLQQRLIAQLGTPERLTPVFDLLSQNAKMNEELEEDLFSYISLLGEQAHELLIERLPVLSSAGRRLILDVILRQPQGKNVMKQLVKEYADEPSVILDILGVAKRIPGSFTLQTLEKFIQSPVPLIRMEGLLTLGALYPKEAVAIAHQLLEDNHTATHRAAIEVLSKSGSQGILLLMDYVRSKTFQKLSDQEKQAVFRTLGKSGSRSVFSWFLELLQEKSGLFRGRVDKMKLLVIDALVQSEHPKAIQLVERTLKNGTHSKLVREELTKSIDALQFKAKREFEHMRSKREFQR